MLRLSARVSPLLKSLGIVQRIIKTNVRQAEMIDWNNSIQDWQHCHGALMACALHQYSHRFGYGIIGSSDPYNYPATIWGSTPSTDYLLSGSDLEIVHDGAGYSRIEKLEMINNNAIARKSIKVCWEGDEHDKNCGKCEKCIITRLSFAAFGETSPPCFDGSFSEDMIDKLSLRSDNHLTEIITIIDYATTHNINDNFISKLRIIVDKNKEQFELMPVAWTRRKFNHK